MIATKGYGRTFCGICLVISLAPVGAVAGRKATAQVRPPQSRNLVRAAQALRERRAGQYAGEFSRAAAQMAPAILAKHAGSERVETKIVETRGGQRIVEVIRLNELAYGPKPLVYMDAQGKFYADSGYTRFATEVRAEDFSLAVQSIKNYDRVKPGKTVAVRGYAQLADYLYQMGPKDSTTAQLAAGVGFLEKQWKEAHAVFDTLFTLSVFTLARGLTYDGKTGETYAPLRAELASPKRVWQLRKRKFHEEAIPIASSDGVSLSQLAKPGSYEYQWMRKRADFTTPYPARLKLHASGALTVTIEGKNRDFYFPDGVDGGRFDRFPIAEVRANLIDAFGLPPSLKTPQ